MTKTHPDFNRYTVRNVKTTSVRQNTLRSLVSLLV